MKKSIQGKSSRVTNKDNNEENISKKENDDFDFSIVTGSKVKCFSNLLCNQVAGSLWVGGMTQETAEDRVVASFAALKGVKPTDELEGMIAAQLVATHQAVMECFRRSMIPEQSIEGRQENLNQANKLARSFGVLLETLNRYRGKSTSEQKVIVEHVHVHAGGQAVVGNVESKN